MIGRLAHVIDVAIGEGILPPGAHLAGETERPWPVILLTALGAWLAAIPLLAALLMLLGESLFRGPGPYIIGISALAGSVALLRKQSLPLFVEQLIAPGLLTGGLALGIGLFRDLPADGGAFFMAAISIGCAALIPRAWLRALLGVTACGFTLLAMGSHWDGLLPQTSLFSLLGVTIVWLLMRWLPQKLSLDVHWTAALSSVSNGWVLTILAGLAFWSGMTFLVGASLDLFAGQPERSDAYTPAGQLASVLLAGAAAAWLGNTWPSLRQSWSAMAAMVVLALAWLMPSLGAVLLILAVCATQGGWRIATAAALAVAWIIGAFYYQLAFPLATKSMIMVVAGAVLGALAWMALRGGSPTLRGAVPDADSPRARLGIAACAVAVLVVANIGIWQKQTLIAEGKPVFVELGPVDPRSLMQGDYMRLAFRLPTASDDAISTPGAHRPRAIGKIDARGVAALERLDTGQPLAPGEIAIELTRGRNGWTLVTDAWYFAEGDANRWEHAKYGEFRVTPDGRALLVGMRGAALEPL